ncbi:hypothetical protein IV203_009628 [Nitzschia inconspicua]|uniref:Uncharacterized protein n=1 Tax=Nitzschia inconspicua TaxID=303405 RepID=A0A9K3KW87_9STRA|nr:hypothetical protein IV203_009628 [Nitzschia inconspicua]
MITTVSFRAMRSATTQTMIRSAAVLRKITTTRTTETPSTSAVTRAGVRENSVLTSSSSSSSSSSVSSVSVRFQSTMTAASHEEYNFDHFQPMGDLFESKLKSGAIGQNLVGRTASIRRVFGPSSNAQGLLTCGGEELARHASFDPDYETARKWIQSRAIGPAVLSPVLISGLVGALVEAALPQTVPLSSSMNHFLPLIVGVEVCARIEVNYVKEATRRGTLGTENVDNGYEIGLTTQVVRVQDDAVVSEGTHQVWMPGYLTM